MRQTSPAPIYNPRGEGFSLIEVLVAIAVVALMVAAAASTVASSRTAENAARFYREAYVIAERIHAEAYGFEVEERAESITDTEEETITGDEAGVIAVWKLFTVRATSGDRRVTFSQHGMVAP